MKTRQSILPNVAAMLITGLATVSAQTVDTSTGTVLDSSTSRSAPPNQNPAPEKLVAIMLPISKEGAMKGEMIFLPMGGSVSVSGRITGLEANKRYQAVVALSAPILSENRESSQSPSVPEVPSTAPGNLAPAAARPVTDASSAPEPVGKPTEIVIGTLVSDAAGTVNVNLTISGRDLTVSPTGIKGGTVAIKSEAKADVAGDAMPLGAGVIVVPAESAPRNP